MDSSRNRKNEVMDYFVELAIYKRKIYAVRDLEPVAIVDCQGPDDLTVRYTPEPNDHKVS